VLNYVSYTILRRYWESQSLQQISRISRQIANATDSYIDGLKSLLINILIDDNFIKLYIGDYASDFERYRVNQDIQKTLLTSLMSRSDVSVHLLPTENKSDWSMSVLRSGEIITSQVSLFADESWYQAMTDSRLQMQMISRFTNPTRRSGPDEFAVGLRLFHGSKNLGYVVASSTLAFFDGILTDTIRNPHDFVVVVNQDGSVIYSSKPEITQSQAWSAVAGQINQPTQMLKIIDKTYHVAVDRSTKSGLGVLAFTSVADTSQELDQIRGFFFLTALIVIIVSIVVAYRIARKITRPIQQLMAEVGQVERSDLSRQINLSDQTEIGELASSINKMIDRINDLFQKYLQEQQLKKQAEINALQQQINPHFLYNILDTVNSIAELNECTEICTISQRLGDMFRYSINSDRSELVRFGDEITHVENYIQIQKIRFAHAFDIRYDIEPTVLTCRTIRFCLQPIVENCLSHAFDAISCGGIITVRGRIRHSMIEIKVADNGQGMSRKELGRVSANLAHFPDQPENRLHGDGNIGLSNVHGRIVFRFGRQYGLRVRSRSGTGTIVTIRVPELNESSEHTGEIRESEAGQG
jgi:sensor histidine kinase YesM